MAQREAEPLVDGSCHDTVTRGAYIDVEADMNVSQQPSSHLNMNPCRMVAVRSALVLSVFGLLVGSICLMNRRRSSPAEFHTDTAAPDDLIAKWGASVSSCEASILIESPDGIVRIDASSYKTQPKFLVRQMNSNSAKQCSLSYWVFCNQNHATLRTQNDCVQPVKTTDAEMYLGVATGLTVSGQQTISFRPNLLPDRTTGAVKVTAVGDKCVIIANQCTPGCCANGFRCVPTANWRSNTGRCLPIQWTPHDLCKDPADSICGKMVTSVTTALNYWELIITSGGGGGHLAAAKNLHVKFEEQWRGMLASAEAHLQTGLTLLSDFGRDAMAQTIASAKSYPAPIQLVDVMSSPCTNVLGELGGAMGQMMQSMWDNAQSAGNINYLKTLFQKQGMTEKLFGIQCFRYIRDIMNNRAPFVPPYLGVPKKVIVTEPLMLASITEAVKEEMLKEERGTKVHLYMTDTPGAGKYKAINFYTPVAGMKRWHPGGTSRLVLHSLAPVSGGAAQIAADAGGLDPSQVVLERFFPVTAQFLPPYDGRMPLPGQAALIPLKAQTPEENTFLGGAAKNFEIAEGDHLTLVMLGSQPTVAAIYTYFDQAQKLTPPADTNKVRWVFFACGPHEKAAFSALYASISKMATAFNEGKGKTLRLRFVPFTGQPAQVMEGRAEVTVTRSGGLTAGELLALATRGDKKQVFLHIETGQPARTPMMPQMHSSGLIPEPPAQLEGEARKHWEDIALDKGMVVWEAGNARYLQAKIGAQLVTPATFAETVAHAGTASVNIL